MAFAGVSLIADGKLCPYTESPVDARSDSAYHLLVVQGYNCTTKDTPGGEYIQSRPFMVGGHRWALEYYPNGLDEEEFISIFLSCLDDAPEDDGGDDDDDIQPAATAEFVFSFIDQTELRTSFTHLKNFHRDGDMTQGEGRFMRKNVLEKSRHLKDDSFIIRCDIHVLEGDGGSDTAKEEKDGMVPDTEKQEGSGTDAKEQPVPDMQSHFSDLLRTKEGTDVTFEVCTRTYAAHRCVLAARSTVFKEQLVVEASKGAVVKIDGIQPDVFSALLAFIYTDALRCEETIYLQLLEAADRYDVKKLKLICEEMLAGRVLGKFTVADIIAVAERRGFRWLKEMCLDFIKSHTRLLKIFTNDGLEEMIRTCSPPVLKELIAKFS